MQPRIYTPAERRTLNILGNRMQRHGSRFVG
jgi:hypothetical protein